MWKKPDAATYSERTGKTSKSKNQTWASRFLASRPMLFKTVGRIVRPEEIEDIVQETFVLSYAASRKKKINHPHTFMLRTARNLALNAIKRADRKAHYSFDDLSEEEFAERAVSVEGHYQAEERFLFFCRAVGELPVDCRRVFLLQKVYGLSQNEIAERLGISPSTVEKHVAKGMALTGKYMVTNGYWDDAEPSAEERAKQGRLRTVEQQGH